MFSRFGAVGYSANHHNVFKGTIALRGIRPEKFTLPV